jgi:phosphoribosyl-ATP pyrophosphohydrolase
MDELPPNGEHYNKTKGDYGMSEQLEKAKQKKPREYFYFDLSDEGHEKLLQKELEEAHEDPLAPLNEVTKVEY